MDFILLGTIFFVTGLGAMLYYRTVPSAQVLRSRLTNKISGASILLTVVVGASIWYVLSSYGGLGRISRLFALMFGLLVFESVFLLTIRWVRSNTLAILAGLLAAGLLLWGYYVQPSFIVLGIIITFATLGAATLLIRLGYLRTLFLMLVSSLWTVYDVIFVTYILPKYTRPATTPFPSFLFPAVQVGSTNLGSGDFMFLSLFTLILLRDFGVPAALAGAAAQSVALLATGIFLPEQGFSVPFLLIMTPLFFLVYVAAYFDHRRRRAAESGVAT